MARRAIDTLRHNRIVHIGLGPARKERRVKRTHPYLILDRATFGTTENNLIIISPVADAMQPGIGALVSVPSKFQIDKSVVTRRMHALSLDRH